jgi:hypothetical protein
VTFSDPPFFILQLVNFLTTIRLRTDINRRKFP